MARKIGRELDATALRRWCAAAVEALAAHRAEIDRLNVYPVPDADTGTNLLLTMRSADAALRAAPDAGTAESAAVLAHGALVGARGNSGVILSQLLRGLADALAAPHTEPHNGAASDTADPAALAAGLHRGARLAWTAVAEPVEGTVLSVATAAAEAAVAAASRGAVLPEVVDAAVGAATAALARTPDQLDVLARANVVDAGGQGFVVLLHALSAAVGGKLGVAPPPAPATDPTGDTAGDSAIEPAADAMPATGERTREAGLAEFGYEVQYLIDTDPASTRELTDRLRRLGDSLVVVGDGRAEAVEGGRSETQPAGAAGTWHVHVHVNDPGAAIEAGVELGRLHRISVTRFADAHPAQVETSPVPSANAGPTAAAKPPPVAAPYPVEVAVLAMVDGPGAAALFEREGVAVVAGPLTVNAVLTALRGTGAAHVVVLPNDEERTDLADAAAAEARAAGQDAAVVPTQSPVQGLAAVAVHDPARRFGDDVIAMAEAAAACRWAEVNRADRDAWTMAGRCRAGDYLGLVEGDVVLIAGSGPDAATGLLDRLLATGGELVTVLLGALAPDTLGDALRRHVAAAHPEVEVAVYAGGQAGSWLRLGVE